MIFISKINVPVVMIIFNRKDKAMRVLNEIRKVKPSKVYIVADGPRNKEEMELCLDARSVLENIDWECEVEVDFSETNLGCRGRISSGLNWVFEKEEKAIILEDDCIPNKSFFFFCQEMLNEYESNSQVTHITGTNMLKEWDSKNDYFFSNLNFVWGWATWRKAWKLYDDDMKEWNTKTSEKKLKSYFKNDNAYKKYLNVFENTYKGNNSSWAYRWHFANVVHDGISIVPSKNLVSNVGFGEGTHTLSTNSKVANLPTFELTWPLKHPETIEVDYQYEYDFIELRKVKFEFIKNKMPQSLKRLIKKVTTR